MSVPKHRRKQSDFEVYHHFYKTRRELMTILINDFGFTEKKADKQILKLLGANDISQLSLANLTIYHLRKDKLMEYVEWFLKDERKYLVDLIRRATSEIFIANSIYPTCITELEERRVHQDRAIGLCFSIMQELQFVIDSIPVDLNEYKTTTENIKLEIELLKAWRKSDNKFKRVLSEHTIVSAANFANVNNNGNCNYNNASNANGVRP